MPTFDMILGISKTDRTAYIRDVLTKDRQGRTNIITQNEENGIQESIYKVIQRIRVSLNEGCNVIFETDCLSRRMRRRILSQLTNYPLLTTQCHVVLTMPEQCVRNEPEKDPKTVLENAVKLIGVFTMPSRTEGFTEQTAYYCAHYENNMLSRIYERLLITEQQSPDAEDDKTHTENVVWFAKKNGYRGSLLAACRFHNLGRIYADNNSSVTRRLDYASASAYLFLCGAAKEDDPVPEKRDLYTAWLIRNQKQPSRADFSITRFTNRFGAGMTRDLTMVSFAIRRFSDQKKKTITEEELLS